jgi:hypothetical protein
MEILLWGYLLVFTVTIIWLSIGKFNKAKLWTIVFFWFLIPGIGALVCEKPAFAIPFIYMAILATAAGITEYLPDRIIGIFSYDGLKFLVLFISGLAGGLYLLLIDSSPVSYILLFFAVIMLLIVIADIIETIKKMAGRKS